jgi:hypothetical protein
MTQLYWLAPILTLKYKTRANVSDSGKHSSLLVKMQKKFYNKDPRRILIRVTYLHNITYQTRLKNLTRSKDPSLFVHCGNDNKKVL